MEWRYRIEARLRLYPSESGGRGGPIYGAHKWRPICEFGTKPDGSPLHIGLCEVDLLDRDEVAPGEEGQVLFRFSDLVTPYLDDLGLSVGGRFGVWEGRVVAEARITAVDSGSG